MHSPVNLQTLSVSTKLRDAKCKVANKCLNVRERVEVVKWKKMVPSLPLLSCELSVSVKENPDRKKKKKKKKNLGIVTILILTSIEFKQIY